MAHDLRAKSTQCWSNCELMTNDQWSLAIRNWNAIVNPCSETELEVHKWLSLGLKLLTTNKRQANFFQRQQHFGQRRITSFLTVILKNYNVCMRRALPVCVHQEIWTQRLCRSRIYQGIQTFRFFFFSAIWWRNYFFSGIHKDASSDSPNTRTTWLKNSMHQIIVPWVC